MIWLLLAVLTGAALALLVALERRGRVDTKDAPFIARSGVLDDHERSWLAGLEDAAGPQRRVLPLVPAARVVSLSGGSSALRRFARRRLARTRFSFVVCDRFSSAICCVVEPGRPRWSRHRHAVEVICRAAGIDLVELPRTADAIDQLRDRLRSIASTTPICPRCHSPMRRRLGRSGALTGRHYWVCSTFPGCREVVPDSPSERG